MKKYCHDKCPYFSMQYVFSEVGNIYATGYMQGECWKAKAKGWTPESAETAFVRTEVGGIVQKPIVTNIFESNKKHYSLNNCYRFKAGDIPFEIWKQTYMYMYYRDCVLDKNNKECIFYVERNLEEWSDDEEE